MIDLTAIWPRRPIRQPRADRSPATRKAAGRRPAPAAPAAAVLPRRAPALSILLVGLAPALLLAALNAAILLSATTPQAAAAPAAARQSLAGDVKAQPAPGVPVLAGRAHNTARLIILREGAIAASRHRPVLFALLTIQAMAMAATTFYLWRRAGRMFGPPALRRARFRRHRRTVNRSADGCARG